MASRSVLKKRLKMKQTQLDAAYTAYTELLKGGVQSYAIGSRNLTKFDLPKLESTIEKLEDEIEILEGQIAGRKPRKAFGVVPRDI